MLIRMVGGKRLTISRIVKDGGNENVTTRKYVVIFNQDKHHLPHDLAVLLLGLYQ